MDGGALWTTVHGVSKSQIRLSNFTFTFIDCSYICTYIFFNRNIVNDSMISVCFQVKQFNITVNQVYALTNHAEEAEVEQFYEDIQDLLELTQKMSFSLYGTGMQK